MITYHHKQSSNKLILHPTSFQRQNTHHNPINDSFKLHHDQLNTIFQ